MTALYLKAAAVLAVSLLAFILVTKAAWPSNVYLFGLFRAWCRSLPEKWKRFRDPEYRRRRERVEGYLTAFGTLMAVRAGRERLRQQSLELEGARAQLVAGMLEETDLRIAGLQLIAVEVMRGLDDQAVADIVDDLNAAVFGGRAPVEELKAFFLEERRLILDSPHFAADHAKRLTQRFGKYSQSAS